jgi:methylated-DNA-[protein]-cysteine S-methyltransferase
MKSVYYYNFLNIKLGIAEEDGFISNVFFVTSKAPDCFEEKETPLLKKAAGQLKEYFDGKRKVFDLPLAPRGTSFQKKVWKALQGIPYGQTRCYGEIAAKVGNPKASRAVGMANNRNPIAIIIPCHRVIGKDGSLTGYASGLKNKQALLDLEKGEV